MKPSNRVFRRDAFLGVRLPGQDKERLLRVAERKRRDLSSLALEFLLEGLSRMEGDPAGNVVAATSGSAAYPAN